ncbi:MAG: T9SS type A sorting domain-containing protein [Bacteroidia bacterium]|nr:T9SS type A sorting domain-containing protein [Bacteroidia bacterium]
MMKKLLLLASVLFTGSIQMKAQTPSTSTFAVTDTLHYYFNKFYFKSGSAQGAGSVPVIKLAASTVTGVTHVGVIYENCGDSMDINGIEGIVAKTTRTSQQSIKVRMYLCGLNSSRMPVLPPIDSTPDITIGTNILNMVGGNLVHGPKRIAGDFAICFRNMSTISGDTIVLGRTASRTYTAWPNYTWSQKYSDGNGVMRFSGTFRSVTNFTASGLGVGTDYEFMLAPRVTYTIQASQAMPQPVIDSQTLCTSTAYNFTNTSSCRISNRMYNLIEFYNYWNQPGSYLANWPAGGWPVDSSFTWKFDNEDNLATGGRIFLHKYNNNVVGFQSDSVINPICTDQNFFRMRHRTSGLYGRGTMYSANQQFTICLDYCNNDAVGLNDVTNYSSLNVFPNPANETGIININGLIGENTINVYDMLGQLISTETTSTAKTTIDLSHQAKGNYLVRINNDSNMSKTVKLIKGE